MIYHQAAIVTKWSFSLHFLDWCWLAPFLAWTRRVIYEIDSIFILKANVINHSLLLRQNIQSHGEHEEEDEEDQLLLRKYVRLMFPKWQNIPYHPSCEWWTDWCDRSDWLGLHLVWTSDHCGLRREMAWHDARGYAGGGWGWPLINWTLAVPESICTIHSGRAS